jgi:hypothetical protein
VSLEIGGAAVETKRMGRVSDNRRFSLIWAVRKASPTRNLIMNVLGVGCSNTKTWASTASTKAPFVMIPRIGAYWLYLL